MKCLSAFTFLVVAVLALNVECKLKEAFAWEELSFAWPSQESLQEAISSNKYIAGNNLPLGLDVWKDKLFITVPRWKAGVASSLNYIKLSETVRSPVLTPYPSWQANTLPGKVEAPTTGESVDRVHAAKAEESHEALADNSTIISTFRIRVDECDRLWVMDTGLADILGNAKQIAPSALVIFDLNTDTLIKRYSFPEDQSKEGTFFANVIVDTSKNNCDNAYAYIPDLGAYGVVVYSFKQDKSWRVSHNFFHFDPLHGDYNVGGVKFQWTDGVFGLALGKQAENGARTVYFHALSSTREFSVPNYILQNETYSQDKASYYEYKLEGDRGTNGQSSAEFLDETTDVIFYTQVNKDAIGCWNTKKPYTPENQGLVDSDSDALVFPNDLKVDDKGTLYVLSDRMPEFIYKSLPANKFNYRILKGNTRELIQGTPCVSA